jgi:beta-lactam-binding protein with PASTA domain
MDSLRKGLGVRLEVSTGLAPNDFVTVPDLEGIFYSEAIKRISAIGLKEGSIRFVAQDEFLPNTVLSQNPREGTKVSQDSSINLIISK